MPAGTNATIAVAGDYLITAASFPQSKDQKPVIIAYELGGGSSLYETGPLARRFRDVHAATQHMLVNPATWELGGRLLLGVPTDTAQL